jgi:hypothetical protein
MNMEGLIFYVQGVKGTIFFKSFRQFPPITFRHAIFLPSYREQKYNAKQAIDTVFWRTGDVHYTVLVAVGTTWLAFQTKQFALENLVLVTEYSETTK